MVTGGVGMVGRDRAQIAQRLEGAFFNHVSGALRRNLARRVFRETALNGHGRETAAEQGCRFPASGDIASDQQHRAAIMSAEGGVDANFANQLVVEPQIAALRRRDRVTQDAVRRIVARVIADHQAGIHALFQRLGIVRPGVVRYIFAGGVEPVFKQGIVAPVAAGVVPVDDDDFFRASPRRAPHRRVDLGGIQFCVPLGSQLCRRRPGPR